MFVIKTYVYVVSTGCCEPLIVCFGPFGRNVCMEMWPGQFFLLHAFAKCICATMVHHSIVTLYSNLFERLTFSSLAGLLGDLIMFTHLVTHC